MKITIETYRKFLNDTFLKLGYERVGYYTLTNEIMRTFGSDRRTIKKHLKNMIILGLLREEGAGSYRIVKELVRVEA